MRSVHWLVASLMILLVIVTTLLIGAVYHVHLTLTWGPATASNAAADAPAAAPAKKERKILYWTDPMYNPPYISDQPGKSPMGMDLLPVYEDQVAAGPDVNVDPVIVQNMGVRVAQVTQGELKTTLRAVGTLMEPEQNHTEINLRVSGWIQKLYANVEGMSISQGDPLFDLYSPELIADSDELITARKTLGALNSASDSIVNSSSQAILDAASRKLSLAGLTPGQIQAIAAADHAPTTFTFLSPKTGHVAEKKVVEGSAIKAGERIMLIADRSSMWLQLQIFERQLPLVPPGTPIHATFAALPGEPVEGTVDFIYPHLDMNTRTAKVRVVLPNHDHRLHENMYANVDIEVSAGPASRLVPREAVIDSGARQIVFVSQGSGHFSPRRVTIGAMGHLGDSENDDMIQILTGLNPGETIVTSGQFLLDSESRIQEAIQKHLAENLLTTPSTTRPIPAAAAAIPPCAASDALFAAYLNIQKQLSSNPASAVDPQLLIGAAQALASQPSAGAPQALAARIQKAASALAGQSLEDQRTTFKSLSQAVIELSKDVQISATVSQALYQFHCPMTDGDWLQSSADIANPFGGPAMKTCGNLTGTISAAKPEGGVH